jgi:hypothetical protein
MLQKKQRSFKQHKHKNSPFQPRVLLFVSTTEEFSKPVHKKQTRKTRPIALLFKPTEEFSNACGRPTFCFNPIGPIFEQPTIVRCALFFFLAPTFCFNPIGIFELETKKHPFLLLVLLLPVFSSHTFERKRQNSHPTQLEIIHHQKFQPIKLFSTFCSYKEEPQFSNQPTSFYFCFNFGHGEIFDQSIILLFASTTKREPSSKPNADRSSFSNFEIRKAILKQTTGSFYFLFQPQRNFRRTHHHAHHHAHTHTQKTHTKKKKHQSLYFHTQAKTKEFSNEKNQKSQQTHSLMTLYFLFQPRSQFSNTPTNSGVLLLFNSVGIFKYRNRAGCVVF